MSARAFALGDVRVELAGGLEEGVAGELLARLPAAPPGAGSLVIALAGGGGGPDGEPSFFHGSLRAYRRGDGFLLRDGVTSVAVSADGRRLDVTGPASAAEGCSELALLVGLVLALRHHGMFHLHAAALQDPAGRGVLVAGTSGAGKTTLALALAAAGLSPLCDDAVFAARREGRPALVAFPRPFHLGERTSAAFPALAGLLGPSSLAGKRPLEPGALGRSQNQDATIAPTVLLLPEIAAADRTAAEIRPPVEALGALLESGALLAADGMPAVSDQLAVMRALADAVRTVRVRLGRDLLADPVGVASAVLSVAASP